MNYPGSHARFLVGSDSSHTTGVALRWAGVVVVSVVLVLSGLITFDHYTLGHPRPPLIPYQDAKTLSGEGPFVADVVDNPPEFVVNGEFTFGESLLPGSMLSGEEWVPMVELRNRFGRDVFRLPHHHVIGWLEDDSLVVRRDRSGQLSRIPGTFLRQRLDDS